jgi:hypothetical protein
MSKYAGDQTANNAQLTTNYRKVTTGSQLGTPQLQAILIKTFNEDWGTLTTDPQTGNPNIKVSEPGTLFAKIVRAVQDHAEIYFIGNPQQSVGGETNITECVIWVNVNTNTSGGELRSEGRWTELEDYLQLAVPTSDPIIVLFAVPDGWIWRVDGVVPDRSNDYQHYYTPVINWGP